MCWISNNKPVIKIATEDIPVFKIIVLQNKELESYYTRFKYQIGKTYTEELENPKKLEESKCYIMSKGFHSYSPDKCIIDLTSKFNDRTVIKIMSSLYLDAYLDKSSVKVNCIIPKGSEYYLNEQGEYVSNQIKIIEEVSIIPTVLTKRY